MLMYFGLINYASTFSQWGGQTRNVLQNLKTKVSNSAGDILIKCAMKSMEHLALLTFET